MRRIDCHVHVVDPSRHPFPERAKVPDAASHASLADLDAVLTRHEIAGALIVQPSPYLTDNAALLDALARCGGRHRGIAAVRPEADAHELDRLAAAGVVGVRLNLVNFAFEVVAAGSLDGLLARLAQRDMWVELQCRAPELPGVAPLLREAGVRVVFDHCGYPDLAGGPKEPGFQEVLAFGREGRAAVKLSGAFRLSGALYPHADLDPFVAALFDAFGVERCVWGSDYPFLWVPERPRYEDTLALLTRWLPREADRRVVLCDAPAALFGLQAP